ncbi:MAG: ankyrin repeat domain-containing protein [Desulfobacterales bacterium]
MKIQTNYRYLRYLAALLCLICSTSNVPAETYKTNHMDKTHDTKTEPAVDDKRVEELIRQLGSGDPNDRISACMALESIGPAARPAIPALRRTLGDKDVTVRILAASTLGGLGPVAATAVPDLIAALQDENEYVRVFVATALGNMGSHAHSASQALRDVLTDPNLLVRSQAEWALQQIGVQDQTAQEKDITQTKSAAVKSSTADSPQKSPLRSFHYREQQLIDVPLKPAVDDPQFHQVSKLFQAARLGDLPTVELLLEQNVTPYATIDEAGRTPLHEAASFGHTEVGQALIQAAIHRDQLNLVIGARDQRHRTPLHDAAIGGHVDVARVLLDHGAVIDAIGPDGLHPLHLAMIKGDETMVEFLLSRGAYVMARDAEGRTAKDYARALHHDPLARSLEEATLRYWQKPTVLEVRATIENYLAAFGSGDVSAARKLSTKYHYNVIGDSIKALSFQHVIEEIKWDKDVAQATVRIKMPSGIIPFFGFFDLKKNKEGWKVDNTNYGFIEDWEDIK